MDRQQTINALKQIAENMADRFGYHIVEPVNHDCGLWDIKEFTGSNTKMSDILKQEFGDLTGFTISDGSVDPEGRMMNYIEMRYRFSNPCLAIFQTTEEGQALGEIEISDHRMVNGEFIYTDDYRFAQSTIWKTDGVKLFQMLFDAWNKCVETEK